MSVRAYILGLTGAAVICGTTYFNDAVMHQTYLVGNNMPISVYGALILFLLLLNPLFRRIPGVRPLAGRELAVVLAMTLAACCIPGSGLMRTFTSSLVLPHHYARTEAGWQRQDVMAIAPDRMLVDVSSDAEGDVLNGFIQGLGVGEKHIRLRDVPWRAWAPALAFWVPVILSFWIALTGLALVVHRQWAKHEQLPYPIAQFANSLLPGNDGAVSSVLSSRLFRLGALVVLAIHANNYAAEWFPEALIKVPLGFDFQSLSQVFPTLHKGGAYFLFSPHLFLTVVAFSFFLAADVSLSLGVGPIVYAYGAGLLLSAGISLGAGGYIALKPQTFLNFGAYTGLFVGFVYTGRHFYWRVVRRAYLFRGADSVDASAVWGARTFLLFFLLFVAQIVWVGLDWQLAFLYGTGLVIIFLVMGRILAETGLFFIQPYTFPCVILWGLLGAKAVGPKAMVIMFMITMVLLVDPRESLMPFLVNNLKMVDCQKAKVGRTAIACATALLIGLAVAIPVQLFMEYDRGANMSDGWAARAVPTMAFEETVRIKDRLVVTDQLRDSQALHGWSRFAAMSPEPGYLLAFGVGLGLVLLFTTCRLRFPKWPFHPVMFLVWNSYPGKAFAVSFLFGCFVKSLVVKYGGPALYRKLKPLMFGVIAGEMLGGVLPAIIGAVYYFVTGEIPKAFRVMPG